MFGIILLFCLVTSLSISPCLAEQDYDIHISNISLGDEQVSLGIKSNDGGQKTDWTILYPDGVTVPEIGSLSFSLKDSEQVSLIASMASVSDPQGWILARVEGTANQFTLSRAEGADESTLESFSFLRTSETGGGGGNSDPAAGSAGGTGDTSTGGSGTGTTGDAPTGDAPTGDAPTGDAPTGDAPTGDAPTGDAPTGDAPTGGTPTGGTPTGDKVYKSIFPTAASPSNSAGKTPLGLYTPPTEGLEATPVPEPSTLLLLGAGAAGLALWKRRKNRKD